MFTSKILDSDDNVIWIGGWYETEREARHAAEVQLLSISPHFRAKFGIVVETRREVAER